MKKFVITFVIFLHTVLFSQNTSMNFLEILPTARQDATSITSSFYNEVGCIFSNPAVLRNIEEKELCVSHSEMFQQIKNNFVSYVLPKQKYVLSLGIFGVYTTGIEGRSGEKDLNPEYVNVYQVTQPEFYYDVYSLATGVGISKKFKNNVNIGVTGKFLYEKIESVSGYSFATDLGAQVVKNNMWLNIAVQNFGFPVKYTDRWWLLPTKLLTGVGYKYKNINLYSEINLPWFNTKNLYFAVGVEPTFFDSLIFLRFGYKYKPYGWELEEQYTGLSCGLGINYFGTKLDYSISSYGILGYIHKISLSLEFDKIGNFYKLLREKIFGKKEAVKKVEENKKENAVEKELPLVPKEIKQPIISRQEEQKIVQEKTEEYKETKVLVLKTNLVGVDSINKIFIYDLVYSSEPVEITDNVSVKELKISVVCRETLPEEISYSILVVTQGNLQQIDFTKNLYGFNIRNFELQIRSNKQNLVFFVSEEGTNKEIEIEKIIQDEQNIVYKILLTETPCLIISEKKQNE
jgi:hypothetical protein